MKRLDCATPSPIGTACLRERACAKGGLAHNPWQSGVNGGVRLKNFRGEEGVFTVCRRSACQRVCRIEPAVVGIEQGNVTWSGWAPSDAEE